MSSRQEIGTSPLVPLTDQQCQTHTEPSDAPLQSADLGEDLGAVSRGYTPSSTPVRPYRFSDHIHKDRHIFLKGASVGIGCGSACSVLPGAAFPDRLPWTGDGVREFTVDEYGNVFYNGHCVRLHMALGNERLPSLSRVQLALPSAVMSKERNQERFPHLHPQYQPLSRRRPFNEQINTYVDTQKRIRSVQCLDDLYRTFPTPVFPFLSTTSPRRPGPPPRAGKTHVPPPAFSLIPTTSNQQPTSVPNHPLAVSSDTTNNSDNAAASVVALGSLKGSLSEGQKPQDPESALAEARHALQSSKQASNNRNYANYFLAKEGGDGTLGRLFESYPKRMLIMHPGRLLRQRTELASQQPRAKLNML